MKIIVVFMMLAAGVCSAWGEYAVRDSIGENRKVGESEKIGANEKIGESERLGEKLVNDTTLLHKAHRDALRDSTSSDNVKTAYIKALELLELSEVEKSANLKRAAYMAFVQILTKLESMDIPYKEYYAAAAYHAGNIQFSVGNYGTAYNCYVTANKFSPKNVQYLNHLAYMNENFNDPARNRIAIDNYKELIKLDPTESAYHLHLYYLYVSFNKYKAAKKELDIYTHTEGETVNSIQPYLDLYDAMKKPEKSIEYLKGFIERNPASRIEGELYLSRFLLGQNQNQESFYYLMKNLDRLPTHNLPSLINPYIQTMLETKDTTRVISFLDTLQTLHNERLEVFQYSHDVRQSLGDTAGIYPVLQRMYELGKEDEMVYRSLAEYYQSHQMFDKFYELSSKGDSLFDSEIWTYFHIVSSYDTASYDRYIDVATRNVGRLENRNVKSIVYTLLAESYGGLRKNSQRDSMLMKEFAAYDSALAYNPENSEALNNYAYNIATSDSVTEAELIKAERMAARAVKLDPSATHILDTYAWVLHLRGDNTTARIYINKLIRIAENNGNKMTATEYFHIYSILAPLNDANAEQYLKLMCEEYMKNPDGISNRDKTREGIEKILRNRP